jgi:hypothetical protein
MITIETCMGYVGSRRTSAARSASDYTIYPGPHYELDSNLQSFDFHQVPPCFVSYSNDRF